MKELDCAIVRDLLPLYYDGVVSEQTAEAVRAHLLSCSACSKEAEILSSELPVETGKGSTQRFTQWKRKLRKKQSILAIVSAILICAILVSLGVFFQQVPVLTVPEEELTVHRAYRFEADGEQHFFVLYTVPGYSGYTSGKMHADRDALVLEKKRTLFSTALESEFTDFWIFGAEHADGTYEQLYFHDMEIWDEGKNADDEVPDYVYELYAHYYKTGKGYWFHSLAEGYMGMIKDGHRIIWDFDGNVLAEDWVDEDGSFPKFVMPE